MDDTFKDGLSSLARYENNGFILDMTFKCPFKRRTRKKNPSEIIIHHSWAPTLERTIHTLVGSGYGTHYAICRNGQIVHLTHDTQRVSHCVEHNESGIGIDLIRGAGQEILDVQYSSLNRLLRFLVNRWNLKDPFLHKRVIFFHRDLRATKCPGEIDDTQIAFYQGE